MSINKLIITSILVRDQDEALSFYIDKLGFVKKTDIPIPNKNERWVTIAPKNQKEMEIRLRKPHADENELVIKEMNSKVGKGTIWTLSTDNCMDTFNSLSKKGVKFLNAPSKTSFGLEAVFEDPYGNRFTLLEIPK